MYFYTTTRSQHLNHASKSYRSKPIDTNHVLINHTCRSFRRPTST